MKFSLKRDAWTVYASSNSLAIEMEFSIKKVSSRVFLKTIWRFLIDLLVN